MNEVYNLRIGDMLYHSNAIGYGDKRQDSPIMAVIYKMTPKYVYYAVCASHSTNPVITISPRIIEQRKRRYTKLYKKAHVL